MYQLSRWSSARSPLARNRASPPTSAVTNTPSETASARRAARGSSGARSELEVDEGRTRLREEVTDHDQARPVQPARDRRQRAVGLPADLEAPAEHVRAREHAEAHEGGGHRGGRAPGGEL